MAKKEIVINEECISDFCKLRDEVIASIDQNALNAELDKKYENANIGKIKESYEDIQDQLRSFTKLSKKIVKHANDKYNTKDPDAKANAIENLWTTLLYSGIITATYGMVTKSAQNTFAMFAFTETLMLSISAGLYISDKHSIAISVRKKHFAKITKKIALADHELKYLERNAKFLHDVDLSADKNLAEEPII